MKIREKEARRFRYVYRHRGRETCRCKFIFREMERQRDAGTKLETAMKTGPRFNIKMTSDDRLISTMGFPILVRWHLYIEPGPRVLGEMLKENDRERERESARERPKDQERQRSRKGARGRQRGKKSARARETDRGRQRERAQELEQERKQEIDWVKMIEKNSRGGSEEDSERESKIKSEGLGEIEWEWSKINGK